MFVAVKQLVCCILLLSARSASGAWTPQHAARSQRRPTFLGVASTHYSDIGSGLAQNDTKLSAFEAGIDAQWRHLQKMNRDTYIAKNRATFSIPSEVPRGTHSIEASYGIDRAQGTEEEMAAAMDLIKRRNQDESNALLPGKFDYTGPLSMALDGVTAVLNALAFVMKEMVIAIEDSDESSQQNFSKIYKSFQGVLELGKECIKSFLSAFSTDEKPIPSSATRAVAEDTQAFQVSQNPTISLAPPEVSANPTISLSPLEASELWGYKESKPDGKWKKMKSNIGLWKDHVVHSTATATNQMAEQVGSSTNDMVQGVTSACESAVSATFQFQKSISEFYDVKEKESSNHLKELKRRPAVYTYKPEATPFFASKKSASRKVTFTVHNHTSKTAAQNALYFMAD